MESTGVALVFLGAALFRAKTVDFNPEMGMLLKIYSDEWITVTAIKLTQSLCYQVNLQQVPGVFNVEKAKSLGICPGPLFKQLQLGNEVVL
jgi:hypothetical protein